MKVLSWKDYILAFTANLSLETISVQRSYKKALQKCKLNMKCNICEFSCETRIILKKHINRKHPKKFYNSELKKSNETKTDNIE